MPAFLMVHADFSKPFSASTGMMPAPRRMHFDGCTYPFAEFEKHLPDAEIIVTTPFHPAQVTRDRLKKAKKLKLLLTAGIGSDHIDLHAAADNNLTVAEVQGRARKIATPARRGAICSFSEGATRVTKEWRRRTQQCLCYVHPNVFEAELHTTASQNRDQAGQYLVRAFDLQAATMSQWLRMRCCVYCC